MRISKAQESIMEWLYFLQPFLLNLSLFALGVSIGQLIEKADKGRK